MNNEKHEHGSGRNDGNKPPKDLLHYTLNTGHTRLSPRSEVSESAVRCLQPIIEHGGEIPGASGPDSMELTMTRYDGGALFTIWQGLPIINGAFAWTEAADNEVWPELLSIYQDIYGHPPGLGLKKAQKPAQLPWLGIVLLPPLFDQTPKARAALSILGDLERCIAWTYYECEFGAFRRNHSAKLIKQTGQVIPIQPNNGRNFTLQELQTLVGGKIQIIEPPNSTGAIMVVNEHGKSISRMQKNIFATLAWQQFCEPSSPRALDDIVGDVVLCHTTQVN